MVGLLLVVGVGDATLDQECQYNIQGVVCRGRRDGGLGRSMVVVEESMWHLCV